MFDFFLYGKINIFIFFFLLITWKKEEAQCNLELPHPNPTHSGHFKGTEDQNCMVISQFKDGVCMA